MRTALCTTSRSRGTPRIAGEGAEGAGAGDGGTGCVEEQREEGVAADAGGGEEVISFMLLSNQLSGSVPTKGERGPRR